MKICMEWESFLQGPLRRGGGKRHAQRGFSQQRAVRENACTKCAKHCTPELVWRWLLQTQPQRVTEHLRVNFFRERHYFVTWINGSSNAVDSSAIERRVKFGKPVVHLETTASLLPIFLAKSRWLIFFSLRIVSMRAIMSADNWISVCISGDTCETFALNQSCLFLIS